MRRTAWIWMGAGVLFFALAARAGDPWKDKTFEQWDNKDIQRVMSDSPWGKVIHIDALWKGVGGEIGGTGSGGSGGGGTGGPSGGMSTGGGGMSSGGGGGAPPPGGGGGEMGGAQTPTAIYVVRWLSSRTIREGLARDAELAGRLKAEDAQKYLAKEPEEYQVLIAGPDMKPFEGLDEKALQEKTFLTLKKSKQKLAPDKVSFDRGPDGKSISAVIFSFPKKQANGEATIPADEKNADFECQAGKAKFKVGFDLNKMADAKGRDL